MGPPAAKPKSSALGLRVLSAAVLIPIVLVLVYLGGWYFSVLVAVAAGLMLSEWLNMFYRPSMPLLWLASALLAAAVLLAAGDRAPMAMACLAGAGLVSWLAASGTRSRLWIPLGLLWFAAPCWALVWLRQAEAGGLAAVLWILAMIWAADTGAYFAGRGIGGPKLAPRVSPNKTWAGLIGGMVAAALVSVGFALAVDGQALSVAIVAAALLAPWSQVGDLAESAVKRHVGVKDSSALIPGHGGIFDRVDALLFAAPAVALIALFLPMGELPWQ